MLNILTRSISHSLKQIKKNISPTSAFYDTYEYFQNEVDNQYCITWNYLQQKHY